MKSKKFELLICSLLLIFGFAASSYFTHKAISTADSYKKSNSVLSYKVKAVEYRKINKFVKVLAI